MKTHTVRELERLLAAPPVGEPPPGLAERIKNEIPDELPAPALPGAAVVRPVWHPHRWRLAAALVMAVGGGALAWWTWRDVPHRGRPQVAEPAPAAGAAAQRSADEFAREGEADEAPPALQMKVPVPEAAGELEQLGYLAGGEPEGGDSDAAAGLAGAELPADRRFRDQAASARPGARPPARRAPHGAELEVTVRDPGARPLPGAVVRVEGPGEARQVPTDAQGRAVFLGLAAAEYTVSGKVEGFTDPPAARVDLARAGNEARVELRPASPPEPVRAFDEEIDVVGEAAKVEPSVSFSAAAVSAETAPQSAPPPPPPPAASQAIPKPTAEALRRRVQEEEQRKVQAQDNRYDAPGVPAARHAPAPAPVPVPETIPAPAVAEPEPEGPLFIAKEPAVGTLGTEAQPKPEGDRSVSFRGGAPRVEPAKPGSQAAGEGSGYFAEPSTGGADEPNDAPYGDVFFRHYGVNPFLDPEEDRLSTFALDVDTGSWGVVRRYLEGGDLPPAEAVRVEEIVNALDYGDPAPAEGDFALHAEGAPTPFGGGDRYRLLRFALQAREVDPADRKPAALTFVIDVSGSMARENRLGLVKASLGLLLDELRPDDRVALVVYGSRGRVVLAPTADKEALRAAVNGLYPEGATNAEEGLALGYDVASAALRPGAINRVILASDGVANVGATGPDSILARARAEAARGIELTTLGFGMGNYNDVLMERLADDGDGRYAYLDTLEEARRVLVEELTGTLQTVAEEARAQVEFNPEVVERYRLLGYENRDLADERFRDDTADAGEIGAGHTVTALYEIKLREQATGRAGERAYRNAPVATLRLRWRPDGAEAFVETERALRLDELASGWEAASPALRLAGLAAELAELLRGSYWAREGSFDAVFRGLQVLQPELAGDERAAELAALAGKAARLAPKPAAAERPE